MNLKFLFYFNSNKAQLLSILFFQIKFILTRKINDVIKIERLYRE